MTHRRVVSGSLKGQYAALPDLQLHQDDEDSTAGPASAPVTPRSRRFPDSPRPGLVDTWLARWVSPRLLALALLITLLLGYFLAANPTPKALTREEQETLLYDRLDSYGKKLPWQLARNVRERFDDAVDAGVIVYEDHAPEVVERPGFKWSIRNTPALTHQPILAKDNFGQVITAVDDMTLRFPNFSPYRPMLYLHTTWQKSPLEDLEVSEILSALAVLRAFDRPMLAAFSCGATATSPNDWKHLRIFPAPEGVALWPEKLDNDFLMETRVKDLPYRAYGLKFPPNADARAVHKNFRRLLAETQKALVQSARSWHPRDQPTKFSQQVWDEQRLAASQDPANHAYGYSIVFSQDWMVAIPRSAPGPAINSDDEGASIPPEAMLGLVAVTSEHQRAWWTTVNYEQYLSSLGLDPLPKPEKLRGKLREDMLPGERVQAEKWDDLMEKERESPGYIDRVLKPKPPPR